MYDKHRFYDAIQDNRNTWILYQLNEEKERIKVIGYFDHLQGLTEYLKFYDRMICQMDYIERLFGYENIVHKDSKTIKFRSPITHLRS